MLKRFCDDALAKRLRAYRHKALKLKAHHPLASYVKARLFLSIDDDEAALELLKPALDPKNPNERVVDLPRQGEIGWPTGGNRHALRDLAPRRNSRPLLFILHPFPAR